MPASPFSSSYRSAWDKKGANSIRIVISGGKIVGALILGDQRSADPLRDLVEHEVNIEEYQNQLLAADENLPDRILDIWQQWQRSRL
jgi:NAD(P)H-nitrite reductase large subunit